MIFTQHSDRKPSPLGVIFDLDGTLVDNEALHRTLFQEMARSMGCRLTDDEYASKLSGLGDVEVMEYILSAARRTRPAEELAAIKLNRYLKHVENGQVRETPGATKYVHRLAAAGVRLAVATNASRAEADVALELLGLSRVFEACVTIEMVTRGKPSPDIHLRAARLIGLMPSECLVYEDSVHGVQAAVAAGMTVIGISRHEPWRLLGGGAGLVVPDFCDHDLQALQDPSLAEPCAD